MPIHHKNNFAQFFWKTEKAIDVYDFSTEKWYTLKATLPQPTAAAGIITMENKIIYIGGEGEAPKAYRNTQCFDVETEKWTQLSPLKIGRHGCGAILYKNKIYVAAGSGVRGGGNMTSIEVFK